MLESQTRHPYSQRLWKHPAGRHWSVLLSSKCSWIIISPHRNIFQRHWSSSVRALLSIICNSCFNYQRLTTIGEMIIYGIVEDIALCCAIALPLHGWQYLPNMMNMDGQRSSCSSLLNYCNFFLLYINVYSNYFSRKCIEFYTCTRLSLRILEYTLSISWHAGQGFCQSRVRFRHTVVIGSSNTVGIAGRRNAFMLVFVSWRYVQKIPLFVCTCFSNLLEGTPFIWH